MSNIRDSIEYFLKQNKIEQLKRVQNHGIYNKSIEHHIEGLKRDILYYTNYKNNEIYNKAVVFYNNATSTFNQLATYINNGQISQKSREEIYAIIDEYSQLNRSRTIFKLDRSSDQNQKTSMERLNKSKNKLKEENLKQEKKLEKYFDHLQK